MSVDYIGDIDVEVICDECYKSLKKTFKPEDLYVCSLYELVDDLLVENGWRDHSLCPDCDVEEEDDE